LAAVFVGADFRAASFFDFFTGCREIFERDLAMGCRCLSARPR
jgi:hypothetical protein